VTIPTGVASIGLQVFVNCTSLTSVTIPSSVASISNQAFYNCTSLAEAIFQGDAPTMGSSVFANVAAGFTVYHTETASGFVGEPWDSLTLGITTPSDPVGDWLTANGLPSDSDLLSDDNHDGVSLLMAYALNLNPNLNLSTLVPQPVFSAGEMSLTYLEASDQVTYVVETTTDMINWTTEGVTMSELDVNHYRTATVPMTGGTRFMRLSVSH